MIPTPANPPNAEAPATQHKSPGPAALRIGVLAIQGDFERHAAALSDSGAAPSLVRTAEDLYPGGQPLDGLVMPGGESTTMLKFLRRGSQPGSEDAQSASLFDQLKAFAQEKPVFGTCAGAILLAREVRNPAQESLALLDIAVERNAYGDQRDSAILTLDTQLAPGEPPIPLETVFIRAPRIVSTGPTVEVLATRDGFPVLVRQGRILAATFHPELSADRTIHRYFVSQLCASKP